MPHPLFRALIATAGAVFAILSGCSSSKHGAFPAPAPPPVATPAAVAVPRDFQAAFARWNYYRQSAGLLPVEYDDELAKGAAAHSRYLVKNHVRGADAFIEDGQLRSAVISTGIRQESQGNQWYTELGSTAGQNSYVLRSSSMPADSADLVDSMMALGVSGLGLLDPQVATVGEGSFCQDSDCIITVSYREGLTRGEFLSLYDVSTFGFNPLLGRVPFTKARLRKPVYFPSPGMQARRTSLIGSSEPNPLTSCPGYSAQTGAPIWLEVGASASGDSDVTATNHSLEDNGVEVESCEIDAANYSNPDGYFQPMLRSFLSATGAVMLIPREPLKPGHTYTVKITADSQPYKWSFSVAPGAQ